ncbi:putative glycoside hydrolase family 7 protein [Rosellinia necatrix]|uniref:Glucanase n=1 Tax=Rosellinia necatrix TaxID=77044 RepID=A0A1S7UJJ2_ROSNE|nr:putative glycoside hydrolase family 7 protein [Rosellinia necatrix]
MIGTALAVSSAILSAATSAKAQSIGTWQSETHPKLTWKQCSTSGPGACELVEGELTVDANWRWAHDKTEGSWYSCAQYAEWNATLCPDGQTCAENCAVDGAQYKEVYGVTTNSDALTMKYVTYFEFSSNTGSRLYLMNGPERYQMFTLLGNEFSFDVDLSQVGCGLNAALNFVSMDEDGGLSRYPANKAGAHYGTGYCDANCPRDLRFINGKGNSENWIPSNTDSQKGYGGLGSCCPQMAIWSANTVSTSMAAHPCQRAIQEECTASDCSGKYPVTISRYDGECDADGCDFNPYRQGDTDFYGPGKVIDTNKKFTVITQFVKGDDGQLESIQRLYQQGGQTIANADSSIPGVEGKAINSAFCASQKKAFNDTDYFNLQGGMGKMSEALSKGMVLSMSIWHDDYANMLWLDGAYPTGRDPSEPGVSRGSCNSDSGKPEEVRNGQAYDRVVFSNFRFGPLNSTFM